MLLPGLVDAHVHLTFDPMGHPLFDVLGVDDEVLLSRMRSNASRALAAGITTVRDLGDARYRPVAYAVPGRGVRSC